MNCKLSRTFCLLIDDVRLLLRRKKKEFERLSLASRRLPGTTADAHIKHEVSVFLCFFFLPKMQHGGCRGFSPVNAVHHFMHLFLAVSQSRREKKRFAYMNQSSSKFKLCLFFTPGRLTVSSSCVVWKKKKMLEELRPSYVIHTSSPQVFLFLSRAGSPASSVKTLFQFGAVRLQLNVCLWWIWLVGGPCRGAGSVNNFACVSQIFLSRQN